MNSNSSTTVIRSYRGDIIVFALVFIGIFLVLSGGLLGLTRLNLKYIKKQEAKTYALQVAEAGVNYYRWHLAHDHEDYTDGTGLPGPYIHDYEDPITGTVGKFSLEITPPPTGSTIVTITSTGWLDEEPNAQRIISVLYGIPSLAHYSFLTNSDIWFGENEHVSGEMHSNGGIRQDGTNDSLLTSAKETYVCQPGHGCDPPTQKPGIWGTGPNNDLWSFPVTAIDFNSITVDLAQIKSDAQSWGLYFDSASNGYHVIFQANGTIDIYLVTRLESKIWQLNDNWNGWIRRAEEIKNETFLGNYAIPANGLIFMEDDVWVEGIVNGRVTLASARFPDNPNTNTEILINGNINYLARDGTHALGLIAQKDVKVPRHAPTDLVIDATLLAQKGRCFRNYYSPPRVTNNIEVYGGIITNKVWTWTWVTYGGNVVDGYQSTVGIYDNSLTFMPPPSFPTTGEYTFISWEEVE
ncbi:hypothetical protein KKD19_04530 [Patescibacteria group bacterium]|nr:hypothetical protein [Patescibacteria group bacterium]MBU4512474.1 hypothetical protein [Patescibacteria group bacterium]MCG2692602.1 hypothetical protein [Candidatus Parcubacteria bacterium]